MDHPSPTPADGPIEPRRSKPPLREDAFVTWWERLLGAVIGMTGILLLVELLENLIAR
jgi:hypothetical protein